MKEGVQSPELVLSISRRWWGIRDLTIADKGRRPLLLSPR